MPLFLAEPRSRVSKGGHAHESTYTNNVAEAHGWQRQSSKDCLYIICEQLTKTFSDT